MRSFESQETVPCAARACQTNAAPRSGSYWHNADGMSSTASSILRILSMLLASLLIGLPAAWGTLALWYQAPGVRLKIVIIVLWVAFSIGVLAALWHGRAVLAVASFALAFTAMLFWWQRILPSNDRIWADDVAR